MNFIVKKFPILSDGVVEGVERYRKERTDGGWRFKV